MSDTNDDDWMVGERLNGAFPVQRRSDSLDRAFVPVVNGGSVAAFEVATRISRLPRHERVTVAVLAGQFDRAVTLARQVAE